MLFANCCLARLTEVCRLYSLIFIQYNNDSYKLELEAFLQYYYSEFNL